MRDSQVIRRISFKGIVGLCFLLPSAHFEAISLLPPPIYQINTTLTSPPSLEL